MVIKIRVINFEQVSIIHVYYKLKIQYSLKYDMEEKLTRYFPTGETDIDK